MSRHHFFASNVGLTRVLMFVILALATLPLFASAENTYVPLVGIPGVSNTGEGDLAQYFNRLYVLTISIGAIIAVVKIFMAGIKWSMSGVITDKASAKADIRGALLGLAILLIPFIVLNEIYPGLTNLNFLKNANSIKVDLTVPLPTGNNGSNTVQNPSNLDPTDPFTPGVVDYGSTFPRTVSNADLSKYTNQDLDYLYTLCGDRTQLKIDPVPGTTNSTISCTQ